MVPWSYYSALSPSCSVLRSALRFALDSPLSVVLLSVVSDKRGYRVCAQSAMRKALSSGLGFRV